MSQETNSKALPPGMILRTGSHAFEIDRVIATGGFGVTYLATTQQSFRALGREIRRGTRVVVKECFREACMQRSKDGMAVPTKPEAEKMRRSFISEAQLIHKCQGHFAPAERGTLRTGLVPVYHAGQIGNLEGEGIFYYVVPYIDGGMLREYLGRLRVADVVMLLYRLISALERLHAMKDAQGYSIVHGDIKPENIMLTRDRYPVLIDFGGAVARLKTPAYAAPEQGEIRTRITPAVDIFSLAVSFYYILRGKLPPRADERALQGGGDLMDVKEGALLNEDPGLLSAFRNFGEQVGFNRYLKNKDWGERFLLAIDYAMSLSVEERLTLGEWKRIIVPPGSEPILARLHGGMVATVTDGICRESEYSSGGINLQESILVSRLWNE